jgi:hypothetical protein
MVMAFVQVSMDLLGWKCVRSGQSCTGDRSWAGSFTHDPLSTPARRVVLMAVVLLALSALLWWLGEPPGCAPSRSNNRAPAQVTRSP